MSTLPPGGYGPAGWAPIADPSEQQQQEPNGAVVYQPRTRDFSGDGGKWDAQHTVDQQVELALLIEQGALASAPEVGNTLRKMPRLNPATIQADVEDRVKLALSRLLADPPQIEILAVATDALTKGQLKVAVTYRNLVTGRSRTARRTY